MSAAPFGSMTFEGKTRPCRTHVRPRSATPSVSSTTGRPPRTLHGLERSEKNDRTIRRYTFPNLANTAEKYGIGEYRFAHNYELAGKNLTVVADGKEYPVKFTDCEKAEFGGKKVEWEAEKLNATLYFVRLGADSAVLCLKRASGALPARQEDAALRDDQGEEVRRGPGAGRRRHGGDERALDVRREPLRGPRELCEGQGTPRVVEETVMAGKPEDVPNGWEPQPDDYTWRTSRRCTSADRSMWWTSRRKIPEGCCAPAGVKRIVLLED
jgi:hypothetical protein